MLASDHMNPKISPAAPLATSLTKRVSPFTHSEVLKPLGSVGVARKFTQLNVPGVVLTAPHEPSDTALLEELELMLLELEELDTDELLLELTELEELLELLTLLELLDTLEELDELEVEELAELEELETLLEVEDEELELDMLELE